MICWSRKFHKFHWKFHHNCNESLVQVSVRAEENFELYSKQRQDTLYVQYSWRNLVSNYRLLFGLNFPVDIYEITIKIRRKVRDLRKYPPPPILWRNIMPTIFIVKPPKKIVKKESSIWNPSKIGGWGFRRFPFHDVLILLLHKHSNATTVASLYSQHFDTITSPSSCAPTLRGLSFVHSKNPSTPLENQSEFPSAIWMVFIEQSAYYIISSIQCRRIQPSIQEETGRGGCRNPTGWSRQVHWNNRW